MSATIAFFKKYICCCLGAGGSDQPNTVLSHNRVNCSSCFGRIDDEEEEGKDEATASTETVYEGRVLRPITSRSVWWKTPLTKEIFT